MALNIVVLYALTARRRCWIGSDRGRHQTLLAIRCSTTLRPGVGSLQPVAMERSLVILDQARDVVNDTTPLPCHEEGAPL
jgi:hypothetical protein